MEGAIVALDGLVKLLEAGEGEAAFVVEAVVVGMFLDCLVVDGDGGGVVFGLFLGFGLGDPVEGLGGFGLGESGFEHVDAARSGLCSRLAFGF